MLQGQDIKAHPMRVLHGRKEAMSACGTTCSHDGSDICPHTRGPRVSEAKVMCAAGAGGSLKQSKGFWTTMTNMLSLPEKGVCQHLLEKERRGQWIWTCSCGLHWAYERNLLWTMSHMVHHRGTEGLTFNRHVREYGFESKCVLLRTWEKHPLQGCLSNFLSASIIKI